ncbi:cold-shock protein [Kineobactrum salinum]|uniref:Cold shock domain-containing protein n=1 Tax=Kineobactrum salinum TaxID=2708301 RepID=A0A6C0U3S9_9GAMM|nr:cold shock domain-containing protein [Kineobactrum salinum]
MQFFVKLVISLVIAALASTLATALQGGTFPDFILLTCFALATVATVVLAPLVPARLNAHPPSAARTARDDNSGNSREQGTVKWFNSAKGFGFIIRDDGEEIFVHFRAICGEGEGRRSLRDGQRVAFHTASSDKGPQAEDVEILDRAG